jgi:glycosyltransferase involved in cell wall biosynthesis
MAAGTMSKKIDVLFWASINPDKRGSFEDYICHLSSFCKANDVRIKFVLGNKINNLLKTLFNELSVDYLPLPLEDLNSIWMMTRILKNFKPKITHFNFIGFGSPLILVCKIMGVGKIVATDHASTSLSSTNFRSDSILESLKQVKRSFYRRRIDHFIAVSNFVGARLQERYGIPAEKVNVIYNGVDLERFRPPDNELEREMLKKELFDVDRLVPVVTYIGQLTREKGLLVYLESINKLLRNHDEIVFAFAGAGPLESNLLHYIEQARNKMIRFLGFRDDTELILKASDIVVVPSIWEEAFGLIIAEALACGVPVIGSAIGGIPEVVLDQQTGILTTPGGADELAQAIEQLVHDRTLRRCFSGAGREHVKKNFDVRMQASKTLELYQQCLG